MARLGENRYGKSRVRLSRITRIGDRHEFNEWTVRVLLEGDFEICIHGSGQQQDSADGHDEKHGVLDGAQFARR